MLAVVGDGFGVGEEVGVAVGVRVGVGFGVAVGGTVGVGVGVGVGEGVGVGVGVVSIQFQVILEGVVIANVTTDELPEAGTLPVPVHPEQTNTVSGDDTNPVILVPSSNQPLVGEGESCAEVIVK